MLLPIFLAGAFTGVRLWDKLVGHYFNYIDYDVAHDFKINFESRYKLHENDHKEDNDFSLKQLKSSAISITSQGKNSNYASLLSQIRNLENIVFVDPKELKKCTTLLELQVLIDSVVPTVKAQTSNNKVKNFQNIIANYKLEIENSKYMESEKERMLGLPFQLKRHQQYPVPGKGTWQFDLFEELFGHPYSLGVDEIESEEKIHKFNYEKFLHPSVIKRFNDGKLFFIIIFQQKQKFFS